MQVNYNMVVDFARPNKSNTVLIAENDAQSRNCRFKLLFDKAPFSMTDVVSATVKGVLPSGAIIFGDATIDQDEEGNNINELEYLIPSALTEEAGNVVMTITLVDDLGATITSFEFYLKVRNALYNEDDYIDDDDMAGFRDLLARTRAALERMEQMVQQDALPNPYPIRITVDEVEYEYNGADLVEIIMGKVAYWGEPSGLVPVTEDDSAAAVAVAAAEEAEGYAQDAKNTRDEVVEILNNLEDDIPTASVERIEAQHKSIITISDKDGTTTAEVYDGEQGPQGPPGPSGASEWGDIGGTLSDQTDLQSALNNKYSINGSMETDIADGDTIPFYDASASANKNIFWYKIREKLIAVFLKLIKSTVGWTSSNLADMSKAIIGMDAYGSTNSAKAVLAIPKVAGISSYTINMKKTAMDYFTLIQVSLSSTFPMEGIASWDQLTSNTVPDTVSVGSIANYIVLEFTKTGITLADLESLEIMVVDADFPSTPYSEYHPPVSDWGYTREEANVLAAKNINACVYKTNTNHGVTFTVDSDNILALTGTNDGSDSYADYTGFTYTGEDNLYKLSGGYSANIYAYVYCTTDSARPWSDSSKTTRQTGDSNGTNQPTVWLEKGKTYQVVVRVAGGQGAIPADCKVKPMLRLATDPDSTYQPPAMTNRQLTERFVTISLTTDASETDNEVNLPSGFTYSNTMVMSFMVKDTATNWRYGEGVLVASERLIIMVKPNNKLNVSCISSEFKGKDMKITLMKY